MEQIDHSAHIRELQPLCRPSIKALQANEKPEANRASGKLASHELHGMI